MKERVSDEIVSQTRGLLGEIQEEIASKDNIEWTMIEEAQKLINSIIDDFEELEHLLEK